MKNINIWIRHAIILIILAAAGGFTGSAQAAPYGPDKGNTIFDRLYESDLVIYGKIMQKKKSSTRGDLTEFEVYNNIKGGKWKKGDYFYVNSIIKHPDKTVGVLYLFKLIRNGVAIYRFNAFYPDKNKQIYNYTKRIKGFLDAEDQWGRLCWLYSQVDHSNDLIAWDAFAQLGMAPYASLKKAAPYVNRESLRYLIGLKKVPDHRKSFYCFLLGLGGDPMDAQLIKRVIENPAHKNLKIVHGAMMAYGLLLNDHPRYYLKQMKKGPDNIRIAVLEAIKNLMIFEKSSNKLLLKPLVWALVKGSKKVVLKAVNVSAQTRLTGPVKVMKRIYFKTFKNYPKGKIAVINYLKFVRRKSSKAKNLLNYIKSKEKNPKIRARI